MSSGPTSSNSSSSSSGAPSEAVRREPEPPLLLEQRGSGNGGASDGTTGGTSGTASGGWGAFRNFNFQDFINPPTDLSKRGKIAWGVALAADLLQVALFPVLLGGLNVPVSIALDVVVAAVMIWLLGWHIAFIPSFALEMVPGVEIAPTWTIAVWIVTKSPFRKSGL